MSIAGIITAAGLAVSAAAGFHGAAAHGVALAHLGAGHGHGAGQTGQPPFTSGLGDGGFGRRGEDDRWWSGRGWLRRGRGLGYGYGYPFWGLPLGDDSFDTGYADAAGSGGGPGPYGPPPPYGAFGPAYPPAPRPLARAAAPSVYGPDPHDGAYAYGYNGHAETPSLTSYDP